MVHTQFTLAKIAQQIPHRNSNEANFKLKDYNQRNGSANGNRTRILALKGLRANRCTIAPLRDLHLTMPSPSNSCEANQVLAVTRVSLPALLPAKCHCRVHPQRPPSGD